MDSHYTVKLEGNEMITYTAPDLDEMILEVAYEEVKASELWDTLQNAECDAKAVELAKVISEAVEGWFEKGREAA